MSDDPVGRPLRKDCDDFPIFADTCPIFAKLSGEVRVGCSKREKLEILKHPKCPKVVHGVWPGQYSSDVFEIPKALARNTLEFGNRWKPLVQE